MKITQMIRKIVGGLFALLAKHRPAQAIRLARWASRERSQTLRSLMETGLSGPALCFHCKAGGWILVFNPCIRVENTNGGWFAGAVHVGYMDGGRRPPRRHSLPTAAQVDAVLKEIVKIPAFVTLGRLNFAGGMELEKRLGFK